MANEMVRMSSRKISDASPLTSRKGRTAARLVVVDAVTALATSPAPACAASSGSAIPSSRLRKMFSSITIELSIRSPTPSASPPNDMMLSVSLPKPISTNVARIASGMASPMMTVLRTDWRKSSTTPIARMAPRSAASRTASSESRTNVAWFCTTRNSRSLGMKREAASDASLRSTASATATVLASGCLRIETFTAGTPSRRAHRRCSRCVSLTAATSASGMRRPPPTSSSTSRMSSTLRNFPSVFPTTSRSSDATRPAATS